MYIAVAKEIYEYAGKYMRSCQKVYMFLSEYIYGRTEKYVRSYRKVYLTMLNDRLQSSIAIIWKTNLV